MTGSGKHRLRHRRFDILDRERYIPPEELAPKWEIAITWALKAAIAATVLYETVLGNMLFGLWGLVALGIAIFPVRLARTYKVFFPVELQILLLLILVADVTLGRLFHFYDRFEFFDKFLHYHNFTLIAFLGFQVTYALYFTGRLRVSPLIGGIVILLVTLGIGGFWEILEYLSDKVFKVGAQGSPALDPLNDTMIDLILDFLGGVFGAVLGTLYLRFSKRTEKRRFMEIRSADGALSPSSAELPNK